MNRSVDLTARETEMFELYVNDVPRIEIAEKMNVSDSYVQIALTNIFLKVLYQHTLYEYHLPKELPLKVFMKLLRNPSVMAHRLNLDEVSDTELLDKKIVGKTMLKLIREGERY